MRRHRRPALTRAILRLVDERAAWPERGRANRRHVVERHSMRRWARDMADAYAELCPTSLVPSNVGTVIGDVA